MVAVETVLRPKAEGFYGLSIMFSQTVGTALCDHMADDTPLGYDGSALPIGVARGRHGGIVCLHETVPDGAVLGGLILTWPPGATGANSIQSSLTSEKMVSGNQAG